MKKVMKQSDLIILLRTISFFHVIIIIGVFLFSSVISKTTDKLNENRFLLVDNATHFMNASSYLTSEVRAYATTGDKKHYDNYYKALNEYKARENSVAAMKQIGITKEEESKVDEMMSLSAQLVPLEEAAIKDVEAGDKRAAVFAVLGEEYNASLTSISKLRYEFLNMLTERTTREVNQGVFMTRLMEVVCVVFVLSIMVVQLISYNLIKKRVIRPILAVKDEMELLSKGDLHNVIPLQADTSETGMMIATIVITKTELRKYVADITSKLEQLASKDMRIHNEIEYIGDFKPIQNAIAQIAKNLNEAMVTINASAEQVSSTSIKVATSSEQLASSSIEQAASIEELSSSLDYISKKIAASSDNAKMATSLANEAGVQLNKSNEHLKGMLQKMNDINAASGEIGKIIETIQNIASQINLLALNASIEAARAGDAGKGFAIVAQQVGLLAGQTAEASHNTSAMIEDSLNTIQSGSIIAQEASDTFQEVMVNAGRAAVAMGDISIAADEQNELIDQIIIIIKQLVKGIETNTSTSEETAAVSEELSEEAVSMQDLVKKFKVDH